MRCDQDTARSGHGAIRTRRNQDTAGHAQSGHGHGAIRKHQDTAVQGTAQSGKGAIRKYQDTARSGHGAIRAWRDQDRQDTRDGAIGNIRAFKPRKDNHILDAKAGQASDGGAQRERRQRATVRPMIEPRSAAAGGDNKEFVRQRTNSAITRKQTETLF